MPDDRLRPDQLAKITQAPAIPGDTMDAILDATPEELQVGIGMLADAARRHLEAAGALTPSRSILHLDWQAMTAIAAAHMTVKDWWDSPEHRGKQLGDLLKILPPDRARWVIDCLRWGRLLPPDQ